MFGLFYSLVLALFNGSWSNYSTRDAIYGFGNAVGHLFGSFCYLLQSIGLNVHTEGLTDYNDVINTYNNISNNLSVSTTLGIKEVLQNDYASLIAGVIATVTVIGVILVTIRAVKSIFRVFLGGRLS